MMRPIDSAFSGKRQSFANAEREGKDGKGKQDEKTIAIDVSQIFFFVIVFVGCASALFYYFDEARNVYSHSDALYANVEERCARSEWVVFDENDSGNINEKKTTFYISQVNKYSDGEIQFVASGGYSMHFFSGKKVEVSGVGSSPGEITVHKIRCVGDEANPYVSNLRQEIMHQLQERRNVVFADDPESQIEHIAFVDNEFLYISLSSVDDEQWEYLVRVIYLSQSFDFDVLAKYDIIDQERRLVFGQDEYVQEKKTMYELDNESRQWQLVW